jgi:DNA-binding transcriptional ArsR family regulator
MSDVTDLAVTASLLGDPARAAMLQTLMDGRALTAKELAFAAHISPQTASGHLSKLTNAGLLSMTAQGRHRYFRLASAAVAEMVESIMAVAAQSRPVEPRRTAWKGGEALRNARTCYDHIAGRLGVRIADSMIERGHVLLAEDGGEVTEAGQKFLTGFGAEPPPGKRVFCRACLDWSERRPHLAGRLGAAIACRCFELGWIARMRDTRALSITEAGRHGFERTFGVTL